MAPPFLGQIQVKSVQISIGAHITTQKIVMTILVPSSIIVLMQEMESHVLVYGKTHNVTEDGGVTQHFQVLRYI